MGAFTDLIHQLPGIVTRKVDRALWDWIWAISQFADNASGATQQQIRYVNKGGSDTTGDGSFDNPFLTVAAAMASITDADTTTKPYVVDVAPGIYADPFTVKAGVYVVGAGSGAGEYNATPITAKTVLAPTAAQVLDASFAGAGNKSGGIAHCGLSTALVANFSAIGSSGAGTFHLEDVLTELSVTFTGGLAGNALNNVRIRDLFINGAGNLVLTDMGESDITGFLSNFGGALTYNQAAAIQSFHAIAGSFVAGVVTLNHTSVLLANALVVTAASRISSTNPVMTGVGAIFGCDTTRSILMSDAANSLGFGATAATTLQGVNLATNIIRCTPTANRVLTINRPLASNTLATPIIIMNLATATFVIDLTLVGGSIAPGSPTYVPPGGMVTIWFDVTAAIWTVEPYTQRGKVTLTNGVSALIPADITARSAIVATLNDINGSATTGPVWVAKPADRVVGTRVGGGGFKITGTSSAGLTNSADNGIYDWEVVG